jgi:glyoxylase-like metal-dependent hydrolase (beta-lactamase superfamily II)
MIVRPFFVPGLAHSSYLLGGTTGCAIVDPRRDVEVYLEAAQELDLKITHILETHLHADFVSGHLELAEATGAQIYISRASNSYFEHTAVAEGDLIELDDLLIQVLETPGHSPSDVSYVVVDRARGDDPVAVFTGDTLFVGDVGRPDLFPGRARELANTLYNSLHQKLLVLPDFCEVYPAHGAGSLCGKAMSAKRSSTIGYEKRYNAALQIKERELFVELMTTDLPAIPDHFARCNEINRRGPTLARTLPALRPLDPISFQERAQRPGTQVLDVRGYQVYSGQHLPNSWHISLRGNFGTFAGWVLPDQDILLVAEDAAQAREAAVWLRRVGLDRTVGYLEGGTVAWANAGLPTDSIGLVSADKLHQMSIGEQTFVLIDTRSPTVYQASHIDGAINIPTPDFRTRYRDLDPDSLIVLVCNSGRQSSLAASILRRNGFRHLLNAAGGMRGYAAAGYALECPVCANPHGPRFLGESENLDMPIASARETTELVRMQ